MNQRENVKPSERELHPCRLCRRLLVVALLLLGACARMPGDDGRPEARVLFDGETFAGWEGNLDAFRIEDEAIVAGTMERDVPQNEFLCTTESFDDFDLRLEFKLLGGEPANAGVQFHTERIPDHHEVIGYQADMGDGWWGALYDESRRDRMLAAPDFDAIDEVLRRDDWNEYLIQTRGPRIRLAINDYETIDYLESEESIPQSGKICLQIHSGPPSEAWYRNIRISEFSPGADSGR